MTRNRKRFWGAIWSLKTGENKVQLFDAPNSPFNNNPLTRIRIPLLGHSSFGDLVESADSNEVCKFAEDLKTGAIGAFVTTSFFNEKTQRTIRQYKEHILLLNGTTIANSIEEELKQTHAALPDYLKSLEYKQTLK